MSSIGLHCGNIGRRIPCISMVDTSVDGDALVAGGALVDGGTSMTHWKMNPEGHREYIGDTSQLLARTGRKQCSPWSLASASTGLWGGVYLKKRAALCGTVPRPVNCPTHDLISAQGIEHLCQEFQPAKTWLLSRVHLLSVTQGQEGQGCGGPSSAAPEL